MSEFDPGPLERMASSAGRSVAEVAALDRCLAGLRELAVARFNLEVSAESATRSLLNLATKLRESDKRLARVEAAEIATHPELMEWDAQMNGYYS